MDRNQIFGLLLIAGLLLIYIEFLAPRNSSKKQESQQQTTTQTATPTPSIDSVVLKKQQTELGVLAPTTSTNDQESSFENENIKVIFSTIGGRIKSVLLKKYFTSDHKPLYLINEKSQLNEWVQTKSGKINLATLAFHTYATDNFIVNKKERKEITFTLSTASQSIIRTYTLTGESYLVESKLEIKDSENVFLDQPIEFNWINDVQPVEKDINLIRTSTTVNFYTSEGFDNLKESSLSTQEEQIGKPIKWVAMKQKYFTSAIIASQPFSNGIVKSSVTGDPNSVKKLETTLFIPMQEAKSKGISLTYYFGPTDYQVMKNVTEGFSRNVYLGWAFFTSINKYLVIPIFHFLETLFSNYGIVIIFLVLIIKIILFPLSYKSYLSMAKIKALKPETDALKEKYGTDMKGMQVEQMQLYRSAGVNPLSGCIPVVLQMPILLAMLNFFPNAIEFRQQSFLWAPDLSTYDSIANLPFSIPGYGTHVSLFCLLMTISTLAYTWLNNQTTSVTGPMKYMQYAMPVIFLFFLNSFPAGLTFYYFVSNIITIAQQLIIRQFVNDNEIRRKIDENKVKNKNRGKSRLQERLEKTMQTSTDIKKKKK